MGWYEFATPAADDDRDRPRDERTDDHEWRLGGGGGDGRLAPAARDASDRPGRPRRGRGPDPRRRRRGPRDQALHVSDRLMKSDEWARASLRPGGGPRRGAGRLPVGAGDRLGERGALQK